MKKYIYNYLIRARKIVATVCACAVLSGCASSVLPASETSSQSPWQSFEAAKDVYDAIEIDKTTREEVLAKGFDPKEVPNIKILNYVDVVGQFGSSFRPEDLPKGVQRCKAAFDECSAYMAQIQNIKSQRVGNVAADLLGFKKKTKRTGWAFTAMVVMIDDVVVYKLWNGTPTIESFENKNMPLGPMQDVGKAVPNPF